MNGADILNKFTVERPDRDLGNTIFDRAIRPSLPAEIQHSLFYMKTRHETEASRKVTQRVSTSNIPVIVDDPRESSVQALVWYGIQVYSSIGVLCHLTSDDRDGARLHNARYSLVAGMAHGMNKPLLMLAEGHALPPIDYRDVIRQYIVVGFVKTRIKLFLS